MTFRQTRRDTVTVFAFRCFDPRRGEMLLAPYKATRAAIDSMRLVELLPATAEEVPCELLDAASRYRRVATGWGALD